MTTGARVAPAEHRSTGMPFGNFTGTPLREVPANYLVWLSLLEDLRDPLRGALVVELGRRVLKAARESAVPTKVPVAASAPEIHIGDVNQDGERLPFWT